MIRMAGTFIGKVLLIAVYVGKSTTIDNHTGEVPSTI